MASKNTQEEKGSGSDKLKRRKQLVARLQVVGLVFLLFSLMVTSVVTTLMATGVIDIASKESTVVSSIMDAQFICDKELKMEYGDKVQTYTVDDLSSRADDKRGGYKMYYELTMYPGDKEKGIRRNTGVNMYYANCFVSSTGLVRQLDLFEEKSYVPKAGKRTKGNDFGL